MAFERAKKAINCLVRLYHDQQCELLYFDESSVSPDPPVQYGWDGVGHSLAVEPLAHRQRVNVLGAFLHSGQLTYTSQAWLTTRDDVITFFDQIALESHSVPRIVLIDNAGIHKGDLMEKKRRQRAKHGPYLYNLLLDSSELNRIEIR